MKVWVMDMATMKTTRVIIGIPANKESEETRIAETRLMCIPGARPVKVPESTPRSRATVRAKIMGFRTSHL